MSQVYRPLPCQFVQRRRRMLLRCSIVPISLPLTSFWPQRLPVSTAAFALALSCRVRRVYRLRAVACSSCGRRRTACICSLRFVCACWRVIHALFRAALLCVRAPSSSVAAGDMAAPTPSAPPVAVAFRRLPSLSTLCPHQPVIPVFMSIHQRL
jgi:hypothetical protein